MVWRFWGGFWGLGLGGRGRDMVVEGGGGE